ncbi:MAG: VanW family protein [Oscillospiraceae bacterium]|jgi:vancomycin resistance protein YoaR|nr:VanW family protein [Oscillospiraceae bacterium]
MNGNAEKTPAHLAPRTNKKAKKKRAPLIVTVAVAGVALAAALTGAALAKTSDAVFPNVYVGGVALGGLSESAAAEALRAGGYESASGVVRAEVSLPNGEKIAIDADEAGLRPDAALAAGRAYGYGRSDGVFSAAYKYVAGALGAKTELNAADLGELDETAVRGRVSPVVKDLNGALSGGSFSVLEDRIEILKGSGASLADEEAVYELVVDTLYKAVEEDASVTAEYNLPPETDNSGGVDLVSLYNTVKTEPVSAKYDAEAKTVTESVRGVSFDVDAAKNAIALAETGETVSIPLIITEPEMTSEMLRGTLFRDVLAERETYIDGSSNRLTNITLASEAINGTVLGPGEEFSYNGIVGERTAAGGYKSAGAYVGGRTVQEIGGGICQVSSTIYDCVLHADLAVTDRRNHQFIVTYLPVGNDATVNWGTTDFKFKNSTDYPLRVETTVSGRTLSVKLIGTKLDRGYVKIESETISTKDYKTVEIEDESIEPGATKVDTAGHYGYVVDTYKYRYDENDTLLGKEYVSRSTYNAQNRIILVPVGTLTTIETPQIDIPGETPQNPEDIEAPPTALPEPTDNPYAPPEVSGTPVETPVPADASPSPPIETPPPAETETPAPPSETVYEPTPPPATPTGDDQAVNGEI